MLAALVLAAACGRNDAAPPETSLEATADEGVEAAEPVEDATESTAEPGAQTSDGLAEDSARPTSDDLAEDAAAEPDAQTSDGLAEDSARPASDDLAEDAAAEPVAQTSDGLAEDSARPTSDDLAEDAASDEAATDEAGTTFVAWTRDLLRGSPAWDGNCLPVDRVASTADPIIRPGDTVSVVWEEIPVRWDLREIEVGDERICSYEAGWDQSVRSNSEIRSLETIAGVSVQRLTEAQFDSILDFTEVLLENLETGESASGATSERPYYSVRLLQSGAIESFDLETEPWSLFECQLLLEGGVLVTGEASNFWVHHDAACSLARAAAKLFGGEEVSVETGEWLIEPEREAWS